MLSRIGDTKARSYTVIAFFSISVKAQWNSFFFLSDLPQTGEGMEKLAGNAYML